MTSYSKKTRIGLDAANFFLADVRDGVGPYLAIFLLASHQWDPASIGIAMSAMGIATLIAQTPAGALIDRTPYKRHLMAASSLAIAIACFAMTRFVTLPAIVAAQAVCGVAAAILAPGVAALSLGIVGIKSMPSRTGRNEAFNHAGNVFAAIAAGLLGHFVGREWIFYLVGLMACLSMLSILSIQEKDIDHERAKGCEREATANAGGSFWDMLRESRTRAFVVSMMLFHFANAAMLPLVGQTMSVGKETGVSLYMSACIIVAQLVMIPVAIAAGRFSESWGRRPVMLVALSALPIRGLLYVFSDNPYYLVSVQALDGIGAGIFGVTSILIVGDLTRGTGRFNLGLGLLSTAVGLGASLSAVTAGFVVAKYGYSSAFVFLASIALFALGLFWRFVPETLNRKF